MKKNNTLKGQDYVKAMLQQAREDYASIEAEVSPHWTGHENMFSGNAAWQFVEDNIVLCVMSAYYGYTSPKWATASQVKRHGGTIIDKDNYVRISRFNKSTGNWSFVDLYNSENISLPSKVEVSPKVKISPKVTVSKDTKVTVSPEVEVSPKVTTKRERKPLECILPSGVVLRANNRTQMKVMMAQAKENGWC